jgi:anti-sigma factor RsiW
MPPNGQQGQAGLAHPQAADWVMSTLGPAQAEEFGRHLTGCPHCQAAVAEFGQLGQMLQHLPPAAEPPPDLETRTIASVLAAAAGDQAATQVHQIPAASPPADEPGTTRAFPLPATPPEQPADLGPGERHPGAGAKIIRFSRWHAHRGLLSIAAAVAAAVIAAIVVPLSLGGGRITPAQATVVIPLHATTAAERFGVGGASGQATARQVGESWTFDLSVHGLKPLRDHDVYVCWWVGPGSTKARPALITGGSFIVGNSGSTTLTMTTGVDPRDFRTMEITAEKPGTGALSGQILLTSQSPTA